MQKQVVVDRFNKVITEAEVIELQFEKHPDGHVDEGVFIGFKLKARLLLENTLGTGSPYLKAFDERVHVGTLYHVGIAKEILKSAAFIIDNDWLTKIEGLISADIFSDFLSMAEHLLNENYKDASAVIIGSTLEEHLRKLCIREGISLTDTKHDGTLTPKKADRLNADLKGAGVYNEIMRKHISYLLDIRNNAAHGKYDQYNKEQVIGMYIDVQSFISTHSL